MKAVAIIPARYDSSRFKGKPIVNIGNKTMIQRVYERVKQVEDLDDVIVATDDQRIMDNVASFNGKAMMTSKLHRNGTERCAEVLSKLEVQPDVVVNVQGDIPFAELSHIQMVLDSFKIEETEIASLCMRIDDLETLRNPNSPKVVFDKKSFAVYFSRSPIPFLRNIDQSKWLEAFNFYKHIGIYGFRATVLKEVVKLPESLLEQAEKLEQLRWLENGYRIHMSETDVESLAVDTPEDLLKILEKMRKENLD